MSLRPTTADFEVVVTRSGARAMRDRVTGEIMHPIVGPIVEAERLYVAPSRLAERLAMPDGDPLVLLDVGLGAGTNAIAAWWISSRLGDEHRRLVITSFDRTLAALETALAPENTADFALDGAAGDAARDIASRGAHESARTSWRFVSGELPGSLAGVAEGSVDVVFWDPFSPRKNPDLWSVAAFSTIHARCRAGATLHTYASATSVRSALLLAGFAVGVGDADREGRESTSAAMHVEDLRRPLPRSFLDRLARSSAPFPFDAGPDALERLRAHPQLA